MEGLLSTGPTSSSLLVGSIAVSLRIVKKFNYNIYIVLKSCTLFNNNLAGKNCAEKYVSFLGVLIDYVQSLFGRIDKLKSKLNSGLYALSTCNTIVPLEIILLIYRAQIGSHLQFAFIIYGAANPKLVEPIQVLQNKALRLLALAKYNAHTDPLFKIYST